jgi:hypothetical protein
VAPTRRVDENDIEVVFRRVCDCILGNIRGVLAVALLEEVDLAAFTLT